MAIQPHSEFSSGYRLDVMKRDDPKQVLWANVRALMLKRYGTEHLTAFARDTGIGVATVTRLKECKTSTGIDILEAIAREFRLLPWQLMVPGFDPEMPPLILGDPAHQMRQLYDAVAAAARVTAVPAGTVTRNGRRIRDERREDRGPDARRTQ